MSGRKRFVAVVGLGVLIGVAAGCAGGCSPGSPGPSSATSTAPMTKLIIEITGGFAYVPEVSGRTLNIAYLNDVEIKETVAGVERIICQVDQIGTELSVLRGNIVDPPLSQVPPNRTFNLDKAVVKIPALNTVNTPLIYNRPAFPPSPAKPTNANHWKNLQYVPSLKDHHPNSGIRPTWRNEVNGRVELRGGTLEATVPTDPGIEKADFEFKKGTTSRGSFAATDKTIYTVDVPGNFVELQVTGWGYSFGTVKIEPPNPGQPVRLKLKGLHAPNAVSSFLPGDEVKDFCAFYSLIEPKQSSSEMVKVYYNGPPTSSFPPGAKPSPGYFCMGDGF